MHLFMKILQKQKRKEIVGECWVLDFTKLETQPIKNSRHTRSIGRVLGFGFTKLDTQRIKGDPI